MVKNLPTTLIFILFLLGLPNLCFSAGTCFVQNQGQWDRDILFRADLPGGFLFLKDKSLVYVLYDASQVGSHHKPREKPAGSGLKAAPVSKDITAHGVEVLFENSNKEIRHIPKRQLSAKFNFFLGNDRTKWAGGAGAFEEVLYENVYQDIDLRIYIYQSTLKYEFIVHPNGDASQIALQYNGANDVTLNGEGEVVVRTTAGVFKEAKPYSFQVVNKRTVEVSSRFVLTDGNRLRFALQKGYSRSQTLTIDPELIFSTYSGSTSDNWGHTATYDDQGNL